ncbi:protein kinase-like domain protein [Colletotrichum tofieldiae]|nr:protein kinase-like domain protein [Colletotrichum tofieldiae]
MLFDKKAKKVTAVLDFDFASVSHPFEEFISMSFSHTGGNVGDDDTAINQAILSGDFTTPPADLDKESLKEWELAKTWNSVLQESVALAPFQIDGVNQIRDLMRLQRFLCPYWLGSASVLEELDEVKRAELRVKAEADLVGWLKKHGY